MGICPRLNWIVSQVLGRKVHLTMTTIYTAKTAKTIRNWTGAVPFPEVRDGLPLHPQEIIDLCPKLVGKIICTLSEHIILYMCREVREQRMLVNDLIIRFVEEDGSVKHLRLASDGEFLDHWPYGFFEERGELLFGNSGLV